MSTARRETGLSARSALKALTRWLPKGQVPATPIPDDSTLTLPDDVLHLICLFAQAPIPARAVEAWDPDRRRLCGQGTLASLMRVNRHFNSIAASFLYSRIITNDFPKLVYGLITPPKRPKSMQGNKARLLALCRYLHLEPPDRLLNEGCLGQMHPESKVARICMDECIRCFGAIKDLGGLRAIFPALESLSTSAYTSTVPAVYGDKWLSSKTTRALVRAWEEVVGDANVPVRCSTIGRTYPFQGNQYYPTDHDTVPEYHSSGRSTSQEMRKQRSNRHYVHTDIVSFLWVAPTDVKVVYFLEKPEDPLPVLDAMTEAVCTAEKLLDDYPTAGQVAERPCELDIDIVIPIAYLDIDRDQVFSDADAMDQLNGQVQTGVQCIIDLYVGAFDGVQRRKETWTITITDGVPLCPACEDVQTRGEEFGVPVVCRKTLEWTNPAFAPAAVITVP